MCMLTSPFLRSSWTVEQSNRCILSPAGYLFIFCFWGSPLNWLYSVRVFVSLSDRISLVTHKYHCREGLVYTVCSDLWNDIQASSACMHVRVHIQNVCMSNVSLWCEWIVTIDTTEGFLWSVAKAQRALHGRNWQWLSFSNTVVPRELFIISLQLNVQSSVWGIWRWY